MTKKEHFEAVRAISRDRDRFAFIAHDTLYGAPEHTGNPIKVKVARQETGDDIAWIATIHRPLGASPIVLVQQPSGRTAETHDVDDLIGSTNGPQSYNLLRERVRVAYYRALNPAAVA